MKLQTRIKHINKRLTHYSRILFVVLSITGIILSFFISNVSQFTVNRADTLAGIGVAGLSTNGAYKVATLKDGSERMVTYTNQWGSPYVQVNSHTNALDYNTFSICDTNIEPSMLLATESIGSDDNGNSYFINTNTNSLEVYGFNSCAPDIYNLGSPSEGVYSIKFEPNTQDVYLLEESQLVRLSSSDYTTPISYSYNNGRTFPVSMTIDSTNEMIYVLFADGYVQSFDINNSFNNTEHNISGQVTCGSKLIYNSSSIFVADSCNNAVYQYSNSFFLQNTYQFDSSMNDFIVNGSYIYITSGNKLDKFNRNNPSSITSSGTFPNVNFVSVDLIGNNVMNLTTYYREVYKFTLTVSSNGPECPSVVPPYELNDTRCERWIHNTTTTNINGNQALQSILVNNSLVVMHTSGLYSQYWDSYYAYPSGYLNPLRIRSIGDIVYILFNVDNNNGGEPAILTFDVANETYGDVYYFADLTETPRDFAIDSAGNLIAIKNSAGGNAVASIFQSGNYANNSDILLDYTQSGFTNPKIEIEQDNLYVVYDNKLRIVKYNSGNYDQSSLIDLSTYNLGSAKEVLVNSRLNGNVDLYVSGANPAVISKVQKLIDVDINGNVGSSQELLATYGRYSSYGYTAMALDPYGNLFVTPSQGSNQISWFKPDGTLIDFDLNSANNYTSDVILDSNNNLYVTSWGVEFQRFDYDYTPATGGPGPLCNVDTPPYVFNRVQCERYIYATSGYGSLSSAYKESVIEKDVLVSITEGLSGQVKLSNNLNDFFLPSPYGYPSNLYADPRENINAVYFSAQDQNNSVYHILRFDIDSSTFDLDIDLGTTVPAFDFVLDSNGDVLVLKKDGSTADLTRYEAANSYNGIVISIDYSYTCNVPLSTNLNLAIDNSNNLYSTCGNELRVIAGPTYAASSLIDLSSYDFYSGNDGTTQDLFVKQKFFDSVDIYVSGSNSSLNGKVEKFSTMLSDGTYDSVQEYVISYGQFDSYAISNIWVDKFDNLIIQGDSASTQIARFTPNGDQEIIDLNNVSVGYITDVIVDSDNLITNSANSIYVTSQNLQYQRFDLETISPNTGTNPCIISGNLSLSQIDSGHPVTINGSVDGDPNPFPLVYATGDVEIRANGVAVGYANIGSFGQFNEAFTVWESGPYTISLYYPGDDVYSACSANIATLDVHSSSGGSAASEITLVSLTPNTYKQITGEDKLIKFHVSDPNNPSEIMTGNVQFRIDICCSGGYDLVDTQVLDSNGDVTFNSNTFKPGSYRIYGYYEGNGVYTFASSFSFVINVYSIGTRISISTSQNPVTKGDSITLSAHLSYQNYVPSGGSPVIRNGWVRFRLGDNTLLGEGLVDLNGDVSITLNTSDNPVGYGNLNAGVHHIRAYYNPDHEGRNLWLRASNSDTLFQTVAETGTGGGSNTGSDIPPSGGEGGNSDFSASIKGKDKTTGSVSQTKIGSILSWVMNYNNLGPNSNQAVTYFPIRENQDYVVGSVQAPANWTITYSQDQTCDDSSFNYTVIGSNGSTDPNVRCIKFANDRVNVPPTRSDVRYITTSSNFSELNVGALGGTDVYKVIPDNENNKLYYFNHHYASYRESWPTGNSMFCFDLEINDTCTSSNPNIVYPVTLGLDGWNNAEDELVSNQTGFAVNAEIVNHKLYIPITNVNYNDGDYGHGFMCWDLQADFYCTDPVYKSGVVILERYATNAWGWGNIGDVVYNPDLQELYSTVVVDGGYMRLVCLNVATNSICENQPYDFGTVTAYDPGWGISVYQQSTGRIYSSHGGNTGSLERQISCMIASTRQICPDFPAAGVRIISGKPDQSVFLNPYNDELCAFLYSDGTANDNTGPAVYCYDTNTSSFYNYLPIINNYQTTDWTNSDFKESFSADGRYFYFKLKNSETWITHCIDQQTKGACPGWEGGKNSSPFDSLIYTMSYAFGCMWGASDSGRVFTFDEITGQSCNPLITLTQGNVAVKLDGNNMFCATNDSDISWYKVKVLDSTTTPSPALLNATVYDSNQCTTDINNVVTCTGSPLKSANLLLNSGHELDISDINYSAHKSLTAILEFQYSSVPTPAPGFYIELNPTNKAQMCADTKLLFSGALCANPITTVCENTNISYVNDPVSNNNGGQYCLNVETYFGKDPNSALCFVAATPEQRIFTVFNPNATLAPDGTTVNFNPEVTYNRSPGSYSFGNGFFGFVQNIIENTVPQVINQETVRQVVESITPQTPLAITAVTAVTTATVVATSVFAAGSGIGQIFGVFLGFLTPKKKKYWGIIFDDLTNKPIAFASITLSTKEIGTDNQMKSAVIAQSVSDLDGQYRLNTDRRNKFYLEVKASGYQPYTKFISMVNPLSSAEDLVYDIPLRRLDAKHNPFKSLLNYRKKGLINFARIILLISSIVGFLFTIYSQINFANTLNWVLLGVYVLIFILSFYPTIYSRIQKRGKVVDVDTNLTIPGAVVRIYDAKQQLTLSLTNSRGEARFDLPAGEYSILASKRGYIMVAPEGVQLIKAVLKKEGYLDRNILMKRIEEAPTQQNSGLENPFV